MIEYFENVEYTHNGYDRIALVYYDKNIPVHRKIPVKQRFVSGGFLAKDGTRYEPKKE
jgi:hypothetical protein